MCVLVNLRIIIKLSNFSLITRMSFFYGVQNYKKNDIQIVYLRKKYTRKHVFYDLNSANRKKNAQFYKKKGVILN